MAHRLSNDERSNFSDLLHFVPLNDLFAIAKTTTLKSVQPTSKEEAIRTIILHESNLHSALNRKKITRSVLFNYLHSKNLPIQGSLDKSSLIDILLEFWTKKSLKEDKDNHIEGNPGEVTKANESVFAFSFCDWFYSRLNEDFKPKNGTHLSEKDFMKDGKTNIKVIIGTEEQTQTTTSAEESVYLIRLVRHQFNLFFSPNLNSEGTRGTIEQHGAMLVSSCGTLHVGEGESVGFFEQKFALLKDPLSENNWKIQMTELILKLKRNTQTLAPQLSIEAS